MEKLQQPKVVYAFIIIMFLFVFAAWRILVWNDTRIEIIDFSSLISASENDLYDYKLEEIDIDDSIRIRGWVIERGKSSLPVEIYVILAEAAAKRGLLLPTTIVKREELTAEYDDGLNYDWSGFEVLIPHRDQIDLTRSNYQILLLVSIQGKKRIIETGRALRMHQVN